MNGVKKARSYSLSVIRFSNPSLDSEIITVDNMPEPTGTSTKEIPPSRAELPPTPPPDNKPPKKKKADKTPPATPKSPSAERKENVVELEIDHPYLTLSQCLDDNEKDETSPPPAAAAAAAASPKE